MFDLAGLPGTDGQVGNGDCLRDNRIMFTEALREVGVQARCDSHEGVRDEGFTVGGAMARAGMI